MRAGRWVIFGRAEDSDASTIADALRQETVGGAIMLTVALVAVVWANVDRHSYDALRHFGLGPLSLEHWASDGLLTIFFFVAGLELKRELTTGSLAHPRAALVPIVAAVGGMLAPALIYLGVNLASIAGEPRGWAIPIATDIAFALAILAVVGSRLPPSLRAFLLTLAIVDDAGAILIIATAFTTQIALLWLLAAVAVGLVWALLQWRRIDRWYAYLPLGVGCWFCLLSSGVHPTICGVALGLLTRSAATEPTGPLDRWEHRWRPISAGVAVPAFALLSAGVSLSWSTLGELVHEPLAVGVVLGLVVGKFLGVFGGSYLTARFTRAELSPELRWGELASASLLAGVGFTVALLIAELAFPGQQDRQDHGKAAVLIGSLIAAVLATVSLRRRTAARDRDAGEAEERTD